MKCGMAACGSERNRHHHVFPGRHQLPSANYVDVCACVRACSFADKCIPVLPALQAHAVLLSQDPEGVMVAPSGAGEDGESHHCETGGAEQRYFQGAVKVIHILHLRGNADALYQVRLFFI